MNKKVDIIEDLDGNKIVFIQDIIFKGKRYINWNEVEKYLKKFVGESYIINETLDLIYVGNDFPDEYTHSNYIKKSILKTPNMAGISITLVLHYLYSMRWAI